MSFPTLRAIKWTPETPPNLLAWYYVRSDFVTLDGSNNVLTLTDRSVNVNDLACSDSDFAPSYEATGWNGTKPSINFDRNDDHSLELLSGTLISAIGTGTDQPFTVFATLQVIDDPGTVPFFRWLDVGGVSLIDCGTDNSLASQLRYHRKNSGTGDQATGGGIALGTGMHRVAWIYGVNNSQNLHTYVNEDFDIDADITIGGSLTCDRFQMGDGGFKFRLVEAVFYSRALTPNERLQYLAYSNQEFGGLPGPTTAPTFVSAGTGAEGTGDLAVPYGASLAAGDLFITVINVRNLVSTPATPSGWTLQYGPDTNPSATQYVYTRDARATGSESGSVTWTIAAGNNCNAGRMYAFRSVATSSFLEDPTTTEADDNTIPGPSITTLGAQRLAVAFVGINEDLAMGPITGMSGGTWAEAVVEFRATTGSNFSVQCLTATMAAAGTISGGSATFGANNGDNSICRAFALIGV